MLRLSEKVKEQKDKTVTSVPKGQGISPAQMRIQKGIFKDARTLQLAHSF